MHEDTDFIAEREEIDDQVKEIVGDHLGIPGATLSREMKLKEDFEADYIDKQELIITVEELFSVQISEYPETEITRVGDIIDAVENELQS